MSCSWWERIWAFARPFNAFWALASVLGLLLIFKGTLDIVAAVMTREVNGSWWLGLVAGILEIVLGFWASQQEFPARGALLLLWVGFFALFRGISEIVIALRSPLPPARLAERRNRPCADGVATGRGMDADHPRRGETPLSELGQNLETVRPGSARAAQRVTTGRQG